MVLRWKSVMKMYPAGLVMLQSLRVLMIMLDRVGTGRDGYLLVQVFHRLV